MNEVLASRLLQNVPVGIGLWDAAGAKSPHDIKLVFMNKWGMTNIISTLDEGDDMLGMVHHAASADPIFLKNIFDAAQTQSERHMELGQLRGRTYRMHFFPMGTQVAASVFEDVTDVTDANKKLLHALESAKAGFWWFDYVQNKQSWDSGIASLMGFVAGEEISGVSLDTFLSHISVKDAHDVETLLARSLETAGVENVELEFRIARSEQQITVIDRVRIVRDADGKPVQAMHVLIDITDKAQLTAQLQQSNGDLKNFAHVASHDLREPLRVIVNYVTLLFEEHGDKLTDPSAVQYREFIETSAVRAMDLVDDLLRLSRAGYNMNTREVYLNVLAQIAVDNLKMAVGEANAELCIDSLPQVVCDAGMMVQVFQNLISNALKFRAPGTAPKIDITSESLGDYWLTKVKDNGIGIEPEYLMKVFAPFYRLYATADYAGTGIGLALCQKIVRAHGGDIWAESEGRGKGTTINFTLPKVV